jgi:YVTN family beta-propeller protein
VLLGPDRIERRAPGYAIRVEQGELDLERFDALAEEGRAAARSGDPARASQRLTDALALWRGAALADLLDEPFAAVETERLEERRLTATEERIEADFALGSGPELAPELEALVRDHPYRERLVAQLMLSLYRGGRQRDALAAFQTARHRLSEELGLEPGPELRQLQRRILEHDPALVVEPPSAAKLAPRPGRRGKLIALGVAAVLVIVGVAIGIVLGTGGTSASPSPVSTNQVVNLTSGSGSSLAGVGLDGTPAAIAALDGSLWIADPSSDAVARLDLDRESVIDRIAITNPGALAVGGGSVWVARVPGDSVSRIDPETGTVTQTIQLGRARATALDFDERLLWIADGAGSSLLAVAPSTGRIHRSLAVDLRPSALAVGKGTIWAADYGAAAIAQVDLRTGRTLATIGVGNGPAALAIGQGAVWIANKLDSTVSRVNPATGSVAATIPVASGPNSIEIAGDSVWVTSQYDGSVSRIDATRNVVVETIPLGGGPTALAVSDGDLWAGVRPSARDAGAR